MNEPQVSDSNVSTQKLPEFPLAKKTVLLVDVNPRTRESRSKIMRTLGVTVHCASSAASAQSRMEAGAYNLILVDLGRDDHGAELLVQAIKLKNPRQLVAYLVGSPLFVASSLNGKSARSPRAPVPLRPIPVVNTPASTFDFGQRVRDVEADNDNIT